MSTILNLVDFNSATGGGASTGANSTMASIFAMLIFLPLAYMAFMMLIYYSKPLYSRLKPIENETFEL
jgi:hypothetical protein